MRANITTCSCDAFILFLDNVDITDIRLAQMLQDYGFADGVIARLLPVSNHGQQEMFAACAMNHLEHANDVLQTKQTRGLISTRQPGGGRQQQQQHDDVHLLTFGL